MTERLHYYLRSFILLGFSGLLGKLLISGDINLYLAPRLQTLCYVTLAILIILTVVSIRQAIVGGTYEPCDCGEAHRLPRQAWRSVLIYGLFVLPLLMGFMLPEKLLGSAVAEKKGVNWLSRDLSQSGGTGSTAADQPKPQAAGTATVSPAGDQQSAESATVSPTGDQQSAVSSADSQAGNQQQLTGQPPAADAKKQAASALSDKELRKMFESGFGDFYADRAVAMYKQPVIDLNDKIFLDGTTILDLFIKEFDNHGLKTMGFVYRQPDFKPNQFVVARFSVSCCTADATVAGLLVEAPDAAKYPTDSWVEVQGQLHMTSINDNEFLMLKAEQIKPTKAPKDPYVYYDYSNTAK